MIKELPLYRHAAKLADAQFDYGDVIPLEWLQKEFEIEIPAHADRKTFQDLQFKMLAALDGFKETLLLEYHKALQNQFGVGYRVVTPQEQTDYAMRNLRRGVRKEIQKAIGVLTHVNHDLLSEDEIRNNADALGRVAALASFVKRQVGLIEQKKPDEQD